jgi:hypothetical protein
MSYWSATFVSPAGRTLGDPLAVSTQDLVRLHPALKELLHDIGREDGYIDGEPNRVEFLSHDAYVIANVKEGESRVRIRAYLLDDDEGHPPDEEVLRWVETQPSPSSGELQAIFEQQDDDSTRVVPRLVFERPVEGFTTAFIESDIFTFAEAWESKSIVSSQPVASFVKGDPNESEPRNAWLLIGDGASYLTDEDLVEAGAEGSVGIYDMMWTAPKNGELGDLVLLYYVAPRKSACFVARLASRPFWRSGFEVNADARVNENQWWAYLTTPIEIEPISFKTLERAADGFLLLRGRSGHYLKPAAIEALTFTAKLPEQQTELDLVAKSPIVRSDLPDPASMSFEDWKTVASGLLPLEASVSEFVAGPLFRLIGDAQRFPAIRPRVEAEYRIQSGFVDFVLCADNVPLLVVEVKLATRRSRSGMWADSPDFRQVQRYAKELDVPGLLIDAHSVLVVFPDAESPEMEIVRSDATQDDIEYLQELLFARAHHEFGGTGGIPEAAFASRQDDEASHLYMAYMPIGEGREVPVVILRGTSAGAPAFEALPIIDNPVYRDIAEKFLQGDAMELVAEEYLGGSILDPHGVATVLGQTLPEERPELLAMLGDLYDPRDQRGRRRRVARRG